MKLIKMKIICLVIVAFPLNLALRLEARTIDLESPVDQSLGSSSNSGQILINKATRMPSGIWNQRRQKKTFPSARIPRKPRKKLNPDSMAQNA
ncbi:MAG: hypothetical protein H7318_18250 [Oligoflexus sp.]|nr:hypothetical protein [Oligoflexus sp.]